MRQSLVVISSVASAFLGGFCCNLILNARPASAQTASGTIRAQGFVLEDGKGAMRGELKLDESGSAVLKLYDRHGRLAWSSSMTGMLPARATF